MVAPHILVFASAKVFDCRFKHADIVIAGDIAVKAGTDTLGVAHLAKDTSVRGGDALNGIERAVGVKVHVAGSPIVKVHVLGGNLAVGGKLPDQFLSCEETALAVRNRHAVDLADFSQGKPRGLVGGNARAHDAGLVAGDGVKAQGRAAFIRVDDFAIGYEP